jgi:hypothetical protein
MISRRTRGSAAGKNSYRVAIKQFIQVGIGGIYVAPQQLDAAVALRLNSHCRIAWYLVYHDKISGPVQSIRGEKTNVIGTGQQAEQS